MATPLSYEAKIVLRSPRTYQPLLLMMVGAVIAAAGGGDPAALAFGGVFLAGGAALLVAGHPVLEISASGITIRRRFSQRHVPWDEILLCKPDKNADGDPVVALFLSPHSPHYQEQRSFRQSEDSRAIGLRATYGYTRWRLAEILEQCRQRQSIDGVDWGRKSW